MEAFQVQDLVQGVCNLQFQDRSICVAAFGKCITQPPRCFCYPFFVSKGESLITCGSCMLYGADMISLTRNDGCQMIRRPSGSWLVPQI